MPINTHPQSLHQHRQHYQGSSSNSSGGEDLPDTKPTIDALIHDTFVTTNRPAPLSTCASPPSSRATTPKHPTYVMRGQRPRPHVTLHRCQSVDGAVVVPVADAQHLARRLRTSHDALLTDFSRLEESIEDTHSRPPTIVVVDEFLRNDYGQPGLPNNMLVLTLEDWRGAAKVQLLESQGLRIIHSPSMALADLLAQLHGANVKKLIVEGASSYHDEIVGAGLYDKILITTIPVLQLRLAPKLVNVQYEVLGNSIVMTAEPEFPVTSRTFP